MNTIMNGLIDETNVGLTTNGAVKRNTTKSAVLDLFSLCGAYRRRSDEDCILLFKNALEELVLAPWCPAFNTLVFSQVYFFSNDSSKSPINKKLFLP